MIEELSGELVEVMYRKRIIAVVLLMQLSLTSGCRSGSMEIEYIFPDGFRGAAVIRENQPSGTPPCQVPWLPRTGVCILNFPSSGVLNTQGASPTQSWHHASAKYTDGRVIPIPYTTPGAAVSKETIALWSFGSIQNGEDWLFIGTGEEFERFRDEKRSNK